jgi:hypothetical protein
MQKRKKKLFYPAMFLRTCLWLLFVLGSSSSHAQFYQGTQMTFGKNRVQYREFEWSFFRFQYFDTYFYVGGQELAAYTGKVAEKELQSVEKFLEYRLDGRIQFLIFNRLSDLRQSNMGLGNDEQPGNIGGYTRIIGNKVFLYNTGSQEELRKQIRAGIAQVLINQIMFGGDLRERLQNAAILSLPDWYFQGLIGYIAEPWNLSLDNRMRDGILTGRYRKFNRLEGTDAIIAGQSIWVFIANTYGEATIPNLLYMTKSGRNIENGFLFVFGLSFKNLTKSWYEYYSKKYNDAEFARTAQTAKPLLRPKKNIVYGQLKISPDGKNIAYTTNELGRYKVYIYNTDKKSRRCILRGSHRSNMHHTDYSFPLLAWHPTGKILAIIQESKGQIALGIHTVETRKTEESNLFNFEKVLDFSYSDDGQNMVMSAVQKGQTDIFVFNLRARTAEQITKDYYDDLNPRFINNSKTILFSSNRTNDTLFVDQKYVYPDSRSFDIFMYDYKSKSYTLRRVTKTPDANEFQPMAYDSENLTFLSDENGVVNRYVAHIDSAISAIDTTIRYRYIVNVYPQTDYSRSIVSQDVSMKKKKLGEVIFFKGRHYMYVTDIPKAFRSSREKLDNTEYRNFLKSGGKIPRKKYPVEPEPETPADTAAGDSSKVDINNYMFQSDFPSRKNRKAKSRQDSLAADTLAPIMEVPDNFALPAQQVYVPAFSVDYLATQLDNSLISPTYQLFGGEGGYYNPSLGALIKIGTSDVFEDYRVVGGFRLPFDLNNTEYFLSYEDLKKRMDKQLIFHRQTTLLRLGDSYFGRLNTNEVRYLLKWPFSEVSSLRGTATFRNDRLAVLPFDTFSLLIPNAFANWGSLKIEYIFDNTIATGLNLYNGLRLKVFAEAFKQVDRNKTTLIVLGTDVRHYLRVHRDIIWANRFAASSSLGSQKLIYYLGSVDNPIILKTPGNFIDNFNPNTPIDYSQNYGFQAVATNVRGFVQNVRNGNNFTLLNSELRIPFFKYLINRPIKSEFIKNFQVVGFADAGTAWAGDSPFADNVLNTNTIVRGPLTITITRQRDPFVYGYGFGLRSKLMGYFIRADWAWGVEDQVVQPRVFYLSLNLDF